MLVLSRKSDEELIITVDPCEVQQVISIKIVEIRGDKVRIGCEADGWVKIHRKEIHDLIAKEGFSPPQKPDVAPVVRIGERLPGELMRRKPE